MTDRDEPSMPASGGPVTRFLFEVGDPASLADQWAGRRSSELPLLALLRTVPEDPSGEETLAILWPDMEPRLAGIEAAWAAAELTAGATLIGLALGARVVLVPASGRWMTELVVIRTRARVHLGLGRSTPNRALEAAHDALVASFGLPWK